MVRLRDPVHVGHSARSAGGPALPLRGAGEGRSLRGAGQPLTGCRVRRGCRRPGLRRGLGRRLRRRPRRCRRNLRRRVRRHRRCRRRHPRRGPRSHPRRRPGERGATGTAGTALLTAGPAVTAVPGERLGAGPGRRGRPAGPTSTTGALTQRDPAGIHTPDAPNADALFPTGYLKYPESTPHPTTTTHQS